MTNDIDQPETDWSIDSPACPDCGSNQLQQLVLQVRDRKIVGEGDIVRDDFTSEDALLETRCSDCDAVLYRSDAYVAFMVEQRRDT